MTDINRDYQEIVLELCTHRNVIKTINEYRSPIYECPDCDRWAFIMDPGPGDYFHIPDHSTDRQVFYDCVVKLADAGYYLDKHRNGNYFINAQDESDIGVEDPDPQIAAMRAVIKLVKEEK